VCRQMKTLLICHHDSPLDREGLAGWLTSFSELTGILEIREPRKRKRRRFRREVQRVGLPRIFDVLAFRVFYRAMLAGKDLAWQARALEGLRRQYPAPANIPVYQTSSPNSPEAQEFITAKSPDIMIARCKSILAQRIFEIPAVGTFVLHPGVCPEYRNAHGGFWALSRRDLSNVGLTLLKVDRGVDTGPVYGYYSYAFEEASESHVVIQQRCLFENLGPIRDKLQEIAAGESVPIDTRGRPSGEWGQPWLSRYLGWKRAARARAADGAAQ
jgi:hypothetical protein